MPGSGWYLGQAEVGEQADWTVVDVEPDPRGVGTVTVSRPERHEVVPLRAHRHANRPPPMRGGSQRCRGARDLRSRPGGGGRPITVEPGRCGLDVPALGDAAGA